MNSVSPQTQSNPRGQVMIEFALVLPIILLIALGVMDLARAVYAYGVISNAARDGAHWGSLRPLNAGGTMDLAAIREKTRSNTKTLEQDRIEVSLPQCIAVENNPYNDPMAPDSCQSWNFLTLTVWYQFQPITLFFTSFKMSSVSTMTIE